MCGRYVPRFGIIRLHYPFPLKQWHISKILGFVTSPKTVTFLSVIGRLQVYFNIYEVTYEKQWH